MFEGDILREVEKELEERKLIRTLKVLKTMTDEELINYRKSLLDIINKEKRSLNI